MADKVKPVYAPLPARAMVDRRLSERHLRTLAVVAAHDRLGKNGIGCWASHERLAAMIGCNYNRLSMNLRDLGTFGYIERVPHPLNKRLRVYRVIYTEADAATMKGIKADGDVSPNGELSEGDTSPYGEPSKDDSSPNREADPFDSSPPEIANSSDFIEESGVNIFRETGNISRLNDEIDPVETAPSYDGVCHGASNFLQGKKLGRSDDGYSALIDHCRSVVGGETFWGALMAMDEAERGSLYRREQLGELSDQGLIETLNRQVLV